MSDKSVDKQPSSTLENSHIKQKKVWWQYILFFHNWSIFEKSLLGINVIASVVFYILALTHPEHFSAYTNVQIRAFKNRNCEIIFDTLGLIASFVNTCCLLLISKGHISNFIWGLVAVVFLGFLSYICGNIGTCIVNWVIQIPMNIVGMVMWKKHSKKNVAVETRELSWMWKGIIVIIFAALTTGFYFIFNNNAVRKFWYQDSTHNKKFIYIFLDAAVLAITILAMILLTLRFTDQWYLWIFCDVVYIVLFCFQKNAQFAITWAIGLTNACYGLYMWKFKKKQTKLKE